MTLFSYFSYQSWYLRSILDSRSFPSVCQWHVKRETHKDLTKGANYKQEDMLVTLEMALIVPVRMEYLPAFGKDSANLS